VNPQSAYLDGFHVRAGLADDPSYSVSGWFRLQWLPLMNEVWLDSCEDWIAVVDATSRYANGRTLQVPQGGRISRQGLRDFLRKRQHVGTRPGRSAHPERVACGCATAIHGSGLPMVSLAPGETYAMDTVWFPVRAGKELSGVSRPRVTGVPLTAKRTSNGIRLTGTFGVVFFVGTLQARVFDGRERLVSRRIHPIGK
jgi:hypothetical protein